MPGGNTPRLVYTDIRIDPKGSWFSGTTPITNSGILNFFKKNLHADQTGIFIYNEFGLFSEKAYVNVEGPVMKVKKIIDRQLLLENEETIEAGKAELTVSSQERFYVKIPSLRCQAVFSRQAVIDLAENLKREDGQIIWNKTPIIQTDRIQWFEPIR